jgi:hypothetical protein
MGPQLFSLLAIKNLQTHNFLLLIKIKQKFLLLCEASKIQNTLALIKVSSARCAGFEQHWRLFIMVLLTWYSFIGFDQGKLSS